MKHRKHVCHGKLMTSNFFDDSVKLLKLSLALLFVRVTAKPLDKVSQRPLA